MSIRIIIADDHGILRAGLRTLLSSDPNLEVVGEATDSDQAILKVQELHPDILLMDIGMPGISVLKATERLVQIAPQTKILILTMHEDSALVQEFIRAGASGYIIKRAVDSELIDAIYAVWRGIIYIHPSLMPSLIAAPAKPAPHESLAAETLTAREIEILLLIASGYSNRQIADKLSISIRTVESQRSNLMTKLNLHSRVELVRYAANHGLINIDSND